MKPFLLLSLLLGVSLVHADPVAERIFSNWDINGDEYLVKDEIPEGPRRFFEQKDADGDGKISLAEHLGKGEPTAPTQAQDDAQGAAFTIRQSWEQEPDGFDRPVYAEIPETLGEKASVVIYFHGNGGSASRSLKAWANLFPDRYVFAAQGYEKSWNISSERSEAPDVEFFRVLIEKIGTTYPKANMEEVTLIGSSNGAGYINRLMIEVEEPLFKNAIPTVSSLIQAQYHDGSFWKPSEKTVTYDAKANPVGGRRILYFHGTADSTVPFEGGFRGKTRHLSAHETAFRWAQVGDYTGESMEAAEGEIVADGIVKYRYEDAGVTFVKLLDGNHGMGPYRAQAMEMIRAFVEEE